MERFTRRHQGQVIGMLSGFGRIRFRGTLRWLANGKGMLNFLWSAQVLLAEDDLRLLEAIRRGEFAIHGLRNRDPRPLLFRAKARNADAPPR